jgi:integrase
VQGNGLEADARPSTRATAVNLDIFIEFLSARGIASTTMAMHLRNLCEALRVMDPDGDLALLRRVLLHAEAAAQPRRNKAARLVAPQVLIDAALRHLEAADAIGGTFGACRFRDALMLLVLVTRPLRLANLTQMELGRHVHNLEGIWWCTFAASEMKEGNPIEFPLPDWLTPHLERYIEVHRPQLLAGSNTLRLWISMRGGQMTENAVYYRIIDVTTREIGRPINPHLMRDIAATFVADESPEDIGIVPDLLAHRDQRTADLSYKHASAIKAQRRHIERVERLRGGQASARAGEQET